MDKQVVFKTSAIGGFEKKAVLDYIYRLNEESSTVQTQLRERLESAEAARRSLEEGLAQANEQIARLKREAEGGKGDIARERARVAELSGQNAALQDELTRVRERVSQLQREAERSGMDREELLEQVGVLQAKREEVDKAASNVGKLLLDARSQADSLIGSAQAEAERELAVSRTEAARMLDEALEEAMELREQAEREAGEMQGKAAAEAEQLRGEGRREAEALVETARRKADLLMMQAELVADDTAGGLAELARHAEGIRLSVAGLLTDYSVKAEELVRMINTAGKAFGKTKEAIRSAGPELLEPEPVLVAVREESAAASFEAVEAPEAFQESAASGESEEAAQLVANADESQDCFFRTAADGR